MRSKMIASILLKMQKANGRRDRSELYEANRHLQEELARLADEQYKHREDTAEYEAIGMEAEDG